MHHRRYYSLIFVCLNRFADNSHLMVEGVQQRFLCWMQGTFAEHLLDCNVWSFYNNNGWSTLPKESTPTEVNNKLIAQRNSWQTIDHIVSLDDKINNLHSDEDNNRLNRLHSTEEKEHQRHAPIERCPAHEQEVDKYEIVKELKHLRARQTNDSNHE